MELDQELGDEELGGAEFEGIPHGSLESGGGIRTFFIFVDLPQHIEFRVGSMPLIPKGTEIELDTALRHPRNPKKTRRIQGPHTVVRRVLKYGTTRPSLMGLTQYLELVAGSVAH